MYAVYVEKNTAVMETMQVLLEREGAVIVAIKRMLYLIGLCKCLPIKKEQRESKNNIFCCIQCGIMLN